MKQIAFAIFFSIVMLVYFAVSWYIYSRGSMALQNTNFQKIFKWTFWIMSSLFIVGQILERGNPNTFARLVSLSGSMWLAFFLYAILYVIFVDLFRLIHHYFQLFPNSLTTGFLSGKMLFIYGFLFAFGVSTYGYFNAKTPIIKHISLEIPKKQSTRDSLKIVLATDVHLGVIWQKDRAEKLMNDINAQNPDMVLFAGDLVDHNPVPVVKNNMGECFENINAPLGIYATTGNHEFIGQADISIDYFTKHGVQYIRDSIFTIENTIQIIGREDREKINFTGVKRKELSEIIGRLNPQLPAILIDHQPVEYDKVASYGLDLMVSGHTHKGQLWPLGWVTKLVYENDFGLIKKQNTNFYTSSGYGSWGPPARTGNKPELVVFTIYLK